MLPQDPNFQDWLSLPPPIYTGKNALVADHQSGILREATEQEFLEYIHGGEFDERMAILDCNDDFY